MAVPSLGRGIFLSLDSEMACLVNKITKIDFLSVKNCRLAVSNQIKKHLQFPLMIPPSTASPVPSQAPYENCLSSEVA